MRKKTLITWGIFILFVLSNFLAVNLSAQNMPKRCRVYCPDGTSHIVNCNDNSIDPCAGGAEIGVRFPKSPIRAGISGAMLGALLCSFIEGGNGKPQWDSGALGGFGSAATISIVATSKNRSRGANLVLGIVAGGTAGAGAGMYEKANASATSAKPDNTVKYALITAAAVGLGSALLPNEGKDKKKKSSSFYRIGKPDFLSNMSFGLTENGIGIVVRL